MAAIEHPLSFLIGTWEGRGEGMYPSIDPFSYDEVLDIGLSPKGYLHHRQRTSHAELGHPLHAETGFWRPVEATWVEFVIAHPSGVVEVCEGPVDAEAVHIRSIQVLVTPTAKSVESIERWYEVSGDVLRYRVSMGAVGLEHQPHLEGELRRVS